MRLYDIINSSFLSSGISFVFKYISKNVFHLLNINENIIYNIFLFKIEKKLLFL